MLDAVKAAIELGADVNAANQAGDTALHSAAALGHATRGAFSERLHDLLAALVRGRLDDLEAPIRRTMAYGATSGSDTLVGLFAALDLAVSRSMRVPGVAA